MVVHILDYLKIEIPVVLLLVIVLGLLLSGSFLYHYLEDWDLMDAAYFRLDLDTVAYSGGGGAEAILCPWPSRWGGGGLPCISISLEGFEKSLYTS